MGTGKTNVEFGGELENVDLDEATNDVNPPFRPVVQFYRSEAHSNNRFGAEEGSDATTYGGKFGFDGFHQKVHAEGWVNKYEVLRNIELKKPIVKSYCKYLCAWASIWAAQCTWKPRCR